LWRQYVGAAEVVAFGTEHVFVQDAQHLGAFSLLDGQPSMEVELPGVVHRVLPGPNSLSISVNPLGFGEISSADGKVLWWNDSMSLRMQLPLSDNESVLGATGESIFRYARRTGERKWLQRIPPGEVHVGASTVVIVHTDKVGSSFTMLSIDSGKNLLHREFLGDILDVAPVEGGVYLGRRITDDMGYKFRVDFVRKDGATVWSQELPSTLVVDISVVDDLALVLTDESIIAFDRKTGARTWVVAE